MLYVDEFLESLRTPVRHDVFNPWYESDPKHDAGPNGPKIRKKHFREYLSQRIGHVNILLLGEALGYRGGHFSGIPMTSERILLGPSAESVARNFLFRRTSRVDLSPKGFIEPTGTFVWGEILRAGLDPSSVLIWNMFPWHPYDPNEGMLTNRTPTDLELERGVRPLKSLLNLVKPKMVIAVGKKAFQTASGIGGRHLNSYTGASPQSLYEVRHPANGGGGKFRRQFRKIVSEFRP